MSTKLHPGPAALRHVRTGFRWARLVAPAALLVAATLPSSALADTQGKLPQGYTTDTLPQLPPKSDAPAAQPVNDVAVEGDVYVDTDPSALSDFREPLSPYGTWIEDGTYGTVWVPSRVVVGADFAPYQTAGHWETTADGDWLWVSDYSWGYIPFHYGRWVWIAGTGWGWIPGRVYAPAWVVWRVGDGGYIGWAAMPPAYYWSGGVAVSLWVVPPAAYVFCPTSYVFHHHVHHYVVHDHAKVKSIARGTRPYKSASPTANNGGGGGSKYKPANPSSGKQAAAGAGRGRSGPASPSLEEARIPQNARPRVSAPGDATALRYARPSTTPRSATASRGSFQASPGAGARDVPAVSPGSRGAAGPASPAPQVGGPSFGSGRQAVPAAPPPPSRSTAPRRSSTSSNDNNNDSSRSSSPSPSFGGGASRSAPSVSPAPAARPAAKPAARPSAGPSRGGGGRGRR